MINFVAQNPQVLNTFLKKFQSSFTKPTFLSFSVYLAGLFLELKRTSIQSIVARTPNASYANTQYFISEAKWNHEKLNDQRIQNLQTNRTTRPSKKGVVGIDDTGSKKWGYKTEGAQIQYYSTEKQTTRCNIVVVSAYCDPVKRYPINFRPYLPQQDIFFENNPQEEFKTKHQLAKELVNDLLEKQIQFSDLVFDNWYFACDFIEFIEDNRLTYITEADIERLISYQGRWVHAGELVKFIPSNQYRAATATNSQGEKKSFYLYSFLTKIKGLKNKVKWQVA
jgi:SRSO17 transposase